MRTRFDEDVFVIGQTLDHYRIAEKLDEGGEALADQKTNDPRHRHARVHLTHFRVILRLSSPEA